MLWEKAVKGCPPPRSTQNVLFQIGHCINAKFNVFRDKRVLDKHKLAFTLAEVFS